MGGITTSTKTSHRKPLPFRIADIDTNKHQANALYHRSSWHRKTGPTNTLGGEGLL